MAHAKDPVLMVCMTGHLVSEKFRVQVVLCLQRSKISILTLSHNLFALLYDIALDFYRHAVARVGCDVADSP